MKIHSRLTTVVALIALVSAGAALALPQQEMAVAFLMENAEGSNTIKVTTGGDHTRMDMGEDASLVFGPEAFLMIAHEQRMWIEFTREMMDRMRQMMQNMPGASGGDEADDDFDPDGFTFSETGNSETILGYDAVEVAVTGSEGQTVQLWIAADAPTGLFDTFAHMAGQLSQMGGPMMGGGMGGRMGGGPAAEMQRYLNLARMRGLPEGKVLKMVSNDGVTMTATAIEEGPFGDGWKSAPDGYTKQSMPMMPR